MNLPGSKINIVIALGLPCNDIMAALRRPSYHKSDILVMMQCYDRVTHVSPRFLALTGQLIKSIQLGFQTENYCRYPRLNNRNLSSKIHLPWVWKIMPNSDCRTNSNSYYDPRNGPTNPNSHSDHHGDHSKLLICTKGVTFSLIWRNDWDE